MRGIDVSPTALEMARHNAAQRGLTIRFDNADICQLPDETQRYDLIIDGHCLHCIVAEDHRRGAGSAKPRIRRRHQQAQNHQSSQAARNCPALQHLALHTTKEILMPHSSDQSDPESPADAIDSGREVPVCPHCFEPLPDVPGWQAPFCPNCAGPVTGVATADPLGQAYSLGHAARNVMGRQDERAHPKPGRRLREAPDSTEDTTSNSPKRNRIIKIGVSLILLTLMLPVVLFVAFDVTSFPHASLTGNLNLIIAGGLILLFAIMLWKLIRR